MELREGCEAGDRRACVRLGGLVSSSGKIASDAQLGGVNIQKPSFMSTEGADSLL
jgi:hypothetical protein